MPSVLIVDNEPDIRFLLRRMAEQAEWYVAGEAASGQEALDCYCRNWARAKYRRTQSARKIARVIPSPPPGRTDRPNCG